MKIDVVVPRVAVAFVVIMVPTAPADGAVMAIVIVLAAPLVIEVRVAVLNSNVLATGEEHKY